MANALEDLQREVSEAKAGQESAIALIEGLRDRLDAMVDSAASYAELQAQVEALSAELSDSTDALAAAVTTPAPTEAPLDPVPTPVPSEPAPEDVPPEEPTP